MEWWQILLKYLIVLAVGGTLCTIAQIFLIKTTWTPSRILVGFLFVGVILEAFGLFLPVQEVCGAGVSVPIIGFGASITRGAIEAAATDGFLGVLGGGLAKVGAGLGAAVVFSYLVALIFKPKAK